MWRCGCRRSGGCARRPGRATRTPAWPRRARRERARRAAAAATSATAPPAARSPSREDPSTAPRNAVRAALSSNRAVQGCRSYSKGAPRTLVCMIRSTPWVLRVGSETHHVDLIMKASAWRAVPGLGRTPVAAPTGSLVNSSRSRRPRTRRDGRVGETTDPGVARAAVPDAGARPLATETVTAGCPRHYPVVRSSSGVTTGWLPRSSPGGLVRRSGRQDEHLATRPPHRSLPNPAAAVPQRATRGAPALVPMVTPRAP